MLGNRQDVEHGFAQKAQGAFRTAQQAIQVELALFAQMRQVVAGQTAVERWEFCLNQFALLVDNRRGGAVYLAQHAFLGQRLLLLFCAKWAAMQVLAAEKDGIQL